jgi:hypothetical protein
MVMAVCRRGDLRAILMVANSDDCPRRHTSRLTCSACHTLQPKKIRTNARLSFVVVAAQGNRDAAVGREVGRVETEDVFVLLVGYVVDSGKQSHVL